MNRIITSIIALCIISLCGYAQDSKSKDVKQNQVIETIKDRRSIRQYKQLLVEKEKIDLITESGILAPNGKGLQSWEVRVVNNPELIAEINTRYNAFFANQNTKFKSSHATYGAPVLALIACDTTYDLSQVDCGLLGGNMILAAQSMGIGSCCLGGIARFFNAPESADLLARLQLPDNYKLLYAIAFGYPAETPTAKPRNNAKVKYIE